MMNLPKSAQAPLALLRAILDPEGEAGPGLDEEIVTAALLMVIGNPGGVHWVIEGKRRVGLMPTRPPGEPESPQEPSQPPAKAEAKAEAKPKAEKAPKPSQRLTEAPQDAPAKKVKHVDPAAISYLADLLGDDIA